MAPGGGWPHYLEPIAKSFWGSDGFPRCPGWAIIGECPNGHRFAKELYCGREWCPICGQPWSPVHQRRFARWLSKAQQIERMGYLVITFPDRARARLRARAELARVGKGIRAILQEREISRGLRRWHPFGEQPGVWNPHFNALMDGGYRPRRWLRELRREIASLVGERDLVLNYQFTREPAKMRHWLKYVTRATFLDRSWDEEMAEELYNFRSMWSWGKWDDPPAWGVDQGDQDLAAVESLESGICPECGEPLAWAKPVEIVWLTIWPVEPLGAGYYRLADVRSPPRLPDDLRQRLHWMELIHRAGVQVSAERAERDRAVEAEYQAALWRDLPCFLQDRNGLFARS